MHIARLRRVGGSAMVAIPPAMLDQLNLAVGSTVSVTVTNDGLVVKRVRPRYTLKELLAMGPIPPMSAEDVAWDLAPPVGSEMI